ncbi:hypothetical protein SUGI_0404650 [Cryptomeria japonica]|uniref:uncharacterized protein LOC131077343 n=1 Tax=Cryptomeria japonica TaxID=3369 RepID=UPI002408A893|nr:uncharacterized protein LOC131077343 [Cryptomeria japonica]GLJ21713.1 hypothetical protein SUGI_0404650 [Cryptomeria japonica]
MAISMSCCCLHGREAFSASRSQISGKNQFGFAFSGHLSSLGLQQGKLNHLGSSVFRSSCIPGDKGEQEVSKSEGLKADEATLDKTFKKPTLGVGKTKPLLTKHKPNLNVRGPKISFLKRLRLDQSVDDLRKFAAPRKKGDIRDVMLMSISFAVYVYISQKIVCAYCAWHSMLKPGWF